MPIDGATVMSGKYEGMSSLLLEACRFICKQFLNNVLSLTLNLLLSQTCPCPCTSISILSSLLLACVFHHVVETINISGIQTLANSPYHNTLTLMRLRVSFSVVHLYSNSLYMNTQHNYEQIFLAFILCLLWMCAVYYFSVNSRVNIWTSFFINLSFRCLPIV